MVITAQVYDGPGFIDDLTDLQIMYGHRVYNILQDGIFETVYLDGDNENYPPFYIYSAEHYFTE